MDFKNYDSAIAYGATIGSSALAANAIGSTTLQANSVTGAKLSISKNYGVIATATNGPSTQVNVLGSGTAPVAFTVTGFYGSNAGGVVGSAALWATTAGTIAVIAFGNGTSIAVGSIVGTAVLNAAVSAGDTVQVSATSGGTFTCYTVYQTVN